MSLTKSGKRIGRAAQAEAAEIREQLYQDMMDNRTSQELRIARMIALIKFVIGEDEFFKWYVGKSFNNNILEGQLREKFQSLGITVEGDNVISNEYINPEIAD